MPGAPPPPSWSPPGWPAASDDTAAAAAAAAGCCRQQPEDVAAVAAAVPRAAAAAAAATVLHAEVQADAVAVIAAAAGTQDQTAAAAAGAAGTAAIESQLPGLPVSTNKEHVVLGCQMLFQQCIQGDCQALVHQRLLSKRAGLSCFTLCNNCELAVSMLTSLSLPYKQCKTKPGALERGATSGKLSACSCRHTHVTECIFSSSTCTGSGMAGYAPTLLSARMSAAAAAGAASACPVV